MKSFFIQPLIKNCCTVKSASKNRWCVRTMFTTRNIANRVNMNLIRSGNHAGVLGSHTNTPVNNPAALKNMQRNLPGQGYDCGRYSEDTRTATGKQLPKHETAHVNIIDRETKKNVAIFSSCKNKSKGFVKVSEKNINGDKLENGAWKEQWMTTLKTPRYHDHDAGFAYDGEATKFANEHQDKIDALVYKNNTNNQAPLKRVHKDSSELYHENGRPIFDANGNEIDYL